MALKNGYLIVNRCSQVRRNSLLEKLNNVGEQRVSSPYGFETLNLSGLDEQHQQFDYRSINSISCLQEFCARNKMDAPTYIENVNLGGSFLCECNVAGNKTYGQALSKKSAKTKAALDMCKKLNLISSTTTMGELEKDLECEEKGFTADVNYVSKLQEYCLSKQMSIPFYKELGKTMNLFTLSCIVEDIQEIGRGFSKKDAKQEAALKVFRKLTDDNLDW